MTLKPGELVAMCDWRGEPVRPCPNQRAFLRSTAGLEIVTKSRGVGFSMAIAMRIFEGAMLKPHYRAVLSSYVEREAANVLDYIRSFYASCPAPFRRKMVGSGSKHVLEFRDANGWAKVEVKAAGSIRGTHGAEIYLDESAHMNLEHVMPQAGFALTHPGSRLTLVSSPLGADNLHAHIAKNSEGKWNDWQRQRVAWWQSPWLCRDLKGARATIDEDYLNTTSVADRIAQFGNDATRLIWQSVGEDEWLFQQECELAFHDHSGSYFSIADIRACEQAFTPVDDWHELPHPEGLVFAGFDVGRKADASELIVGEFDPQTGVYKVLMRRTIRDVKLSDQQSYVDGLLANYPVRRLTVDGAGLGMQLAEDLHAKYPDRVVMYVANRSSKELQFLELRRRFRERRIVIPAMRDLVIQLCAIKQKISSSGNIIIEQPRTAGSHCDAVSALCLANPPLDAAADDGLGTVHMRVFGSEDPARYRDWNDDGRIKKLARGYLDKSDQAIRFLLSPESSHARGDSDDDKARRLALHLVLDWRELYDRQLDAWKEENARRRAAAEGRGPLPEPTPPWEIADDPVRVEELYEEFRQPTLNDYGIGTEAADIGQLLLGPRYDGRW